MLAIVRRIIDMSKRIIGFIAAAAIAAAPMASYALGTNEKGCLVGGAGGALAGNLIGGSTKGTVIGGALGCGVGVYANKQRVNKIDAEKREQQRKEAAARKRQYAKAHPHREAPVATETAAR
jgi:predicted lipid-binding transport protein (Tim44 family)